MAPKWPRAIREVRAGLPDPGSAAPEPDPDPEPAESPPEEPTPSAPTERPAASAEAPSASAEAPGAPDDETRELAAMAEALLAQATELRRKTKQLAAELAGADDPEPARDTASSMRLVALNMAAAGRSREEAAQYLRQTFGEEPDPALLDEVFSRGGGAFA